MLCTLGWLQSTGKPSFFSRLGQSRCLHAPSRAKDEFTQIIWFNCKLHLSISYESKTGKEGNYLELIRLDDWRSFIWSSRYHLIDCRSTSGGWSYVPWKILELGEETKRTNLDGCRSQFDYVYRHGSEPMWVILWAMPEGGVWFAVLLGYGIKLNYREIC